MYVEVQRVNPNLMALRLQVFDAFSAGGAVGEREILAFQQRLNCRTRAFDDADLTIVAEFSVNANTPRRDLLRRAS